MAGNGQVITNESIHWQVCQDDDKGGRHDWTSDVVAEAEQAVAGVGAELLTSSRAAQSSALGSANGMRKALRVLNGVYLHGVDPSEMASIGQDHGHPGKLRVRLRFPTEASARAAISQATATLRKHDQAGESGDMWEITLDVDAIKRTEAQATIAGDNPFAQLRWDW